jgi:uncharacterized protein
MSYKFHPLPAQCLALAAALLSASIAFAKPPIKPLTIGNQTIQAEIVATPADRQQGLMFRESMPANQGMLFVFDDVASHCFWMKNTPLPLTIGFLDEAGKLINTVDMAPFDESSHCPTKPAKYALEMNKGWFVKHHVKNGAVVKGLPKQ